jgi:hypothetical protein
MPLRGNAAVQRVYAAATRNHDEQRSLDGNLDVGDEIFLRFCLQKAQTRVLWRP